VSSRGGGDTGRKRRRCLWKKDASPSSANNTKTELTTMPTMAATGKDEESEAAKGMMVVAAVVGLRVEDVVHGLDFLRVVKECDEAEADSVGPDSDFAVSGAEANNELV
jgi:hypothetical protein